MSVWIECKNTDKVESIANLISDFEEQYGVTVLWDYRGDSLARGSGTTESILFIEVLGWGGIPIKDIEVGSTTMLELLILITNHEGGWELD